MTALQLVVGITDIVLPKQNERDLLDVPQVLRDQLRYHLVENADEVLELGLASPG